MKNTRRLTGKDRCEYKGCKRIADSIVYDRIANKVLLCCGPHADQVADFGAPEYIDICQNCGCQWGINYVS